MSSEITLQDRLSFIGLDDRKRTQLREFLPALEQAIPVILDKFYDRIRAHPTLRQMFATEDRVAHARKMQTEHWRRMFSARYDEEYVESVRRIGRVHNKLGLDASWYIGGYTIVMNEVHGVALKLSRKLISTAAACEQAESLVRAIDMAVLLDMDLVIGVFLDEKAKDYRDRLQDLAAQFEESFAGVTQRVSETATSLNGSASVLTQAAETTNAQAGSAAAGATQTSANVQTVASAAEELAASIGEITTQVSLSSKESRAAVEAVEGALAIVHNLSGAAEQISGVVNLIQTIAEQTNLLALNATIEAARAGESGKGFAVVAGEVKSLAQQTAKATEGITGQVAEIRAATENTASAIGIIKQAIGRVEEMSNAIAGAVEEQNAVTAEISRSVTEASAGTQDVSKNVELVKLQTDETLQSAAEVANGSNEVLSGMKELQDQAAAFLDRIRNADRREHHRETKGVMVSLQIGGRSREALTTDVSPGGAGFRVDSSNLRVGDRGRVVLVDGRSAAIELKAVNPGRVHAEFERPTEALHLFDGAQRLAATG